MTSLPSEPSIKSHVTVIGAGLAGSEAAYAAAERGCLVSLLEMRPSRTTGAHVSGDFGELVCSNSFKSNSPSSPSGLLKEEMRQLRSAVLRCADNSRVPGGEALAVDREQYAKQLSNLLRSHPKITVMESAATGETVEQALQSGPVVLATGPLTTPELSEWIRGKTGEDHLAFYDAVSPTVDASTIDNSIAFRQSRYDKGGDDYINCPFNKEEYETFVEALVSAERALPHGLTEEESLEKIQYFAGCMPIEVIAERGARSLAFGNFKPVGLTDPRTGRRPYAALQLRPENKEGTLYSLVACQTRLKWGEQKRVFQLVPGLQNAEFVRFGVIHRNTYLRAPEALTPFLELNSCPGVYVAGQITGVEGYLESAAIGQLVGIIVSNNLANREFVLPPRKTAIGSLLSHLQDQTPRDFAPMNINWGLLPDPDPIPRDKQLKRDQKLAAARAEFAEWRIQVQE